MADRAYILVNVNDPLDSALIEKVMAKLYEDEAVEFLDRVMGPYDIMALLECSKPNETATRLGGIEGVKRIQLCKVVTSTHHPAHPAGHVIG